VTIAVRLGSIIRTYGTISLPGSDYLQKQLRLRPQKALIDLYGFDDLSFLISMAERTRLRALLKEEEIQLIEMPNICR